MLRNGSEDENIQHKAAKPYRRPSPGAGAHMLEKERYCIDIVTQISAARAALRKVEQEVMRDHVHHCVRHAMSSGSPAEQDKKIEELMAVLARSD